MRTKNVYVASVLLGIILWSCNKKEDSTTNSVSLKTSINSGVQSLTTAMNAISASPGFQVFTGANEASTKSAEISSSDSLTNSILLADIAGKYDYKANTVKIGHRSIMRFFTKTGDSQQLIVSLPEEKVKAYRTLLRYAPGDSLLKNNYVVTVSDYQFKFNFWGSVDYRLASSVKISDVDAGSLQIQAKNSMNNGYKYSSEFAFPEGYIAKCQYASGDTAISSYSILQGSKTLYEEKRTAIKSSDVTKHRERSYSLLIGNVLIERKIGIGQQASLDSAKVYVDGVLQLKSKVEIVDVSTDITDQSVTSQKRDLKITFDDGTSSTLSELAGKVINDISSLFASMKQVNFASRIVDWIAWDIYTKK